MLISQSKDLDICHVPKFSAPEAQIFGFLYPSRMISKGIFDDFGGVFYRFEVDICEKFRL